MGPRRPAPAGKKSDKETTQTKPSLPLQLQQTILDQFSRAFPCDDATNLKTTIQEIKTHLYNRDFTAAFSTPEYLQAYALRWSTSRALCYTDVFSTLNFLQPTQHVRNISARQVVCIGGGAGAEIVALAAASHADDVKMEVTAVDVADWSSTIDRLRDVLVTPPMLSAYAGEAMRKANRAMVEAESFDVRSVQMDALECRDEGLKGMMAGVGMCTIMFTLNELFSTSIAKTTALLLGLGEVMEIDAWLLVVDSPGSYSEVKLGKEQKTKQYPMKWLLDHTLMEVAKGKWAKVLEDDSRWFRVSSQLKYPIDLESMRYQIHLYRRIES